MGDPFHRQNGDDAMTMADMLDEWEALCEAEKQQ